MSEPTFAVLATGPSMSQELADYVRGKCRAVAVSDAYRLAPWADALVSHDPTWWDYHPDAWRFAGRRFCGRYHHACQTLSGEWPWTCGINSGLQGMRVAELLGAKRIILLGFDLHDKAGAHFFGEHPPGLSRTSSRRFEDHIRQFDKWGAEQPEIINATPCSALLRFPFGDIREILHP